MPTLPAFQFQTEETRKFLEVLPEYSYLLFSLGKKFYTVFGAVAAAESLGLFNFFLMVLYVVHSSTHALPFLSVPRGQM